jgi:hypothetical protein
MRNRILVAQVAMALLSAAVAAHLLMHLLPGDHPLTQASRAQPIGGVVASAPPTPAPPDHGEPDGHLMGALCLAELPALVAMAALAPRRRRPSTAPPRAPAHALHPRARPAPPPPSRIDAGVVLLV